MIEGAFACLASSFQQYHWNARRKVNAQCTVVAQIQLKAFWDIGLYAIGLHTKYKIQKADW